MERKETAAVKKSNSRRVPGQQVAVGNGGVPVRVPGASEPSEEVIHVVRDGDDTVRRIEITCCCGRHLSLVCEPVEVAGSSPGAGPHPTDSAESR